MAGLALGVLATIDRSLAEQKNFTGTFCYLGKPLQKDDVITTHYSHITDAVACIRNNHGEGPLSSKTALTVDPSRMVLKTIRLVCSHGRPVTHETLCNATREKKTSTIRWIPPEFAGCDTERCTACLNLRWKTIYAVPPEFPEEVSLPCQAWVVTTMETQHKGHLPNQQPVAVLSDQEKSRIGHAMEVANLSPSQTAQLFEQPERALPAGLLKSLKATSKKGLRGNLNASAALLQNLQQQSTDGNLSYIALFSNEIDTKRGAAASIAKAHQDVISPSDEQHVYCGEGKTSVHDAQRYFTSQRILMGAAWISTAALDKVRRFPEVLSVDVTSKTNKEGRPLFKVQAIDGDGKIFTVCTVLLWDESREAFAWCLQTALPKLVGAQVLHAVATILSDGDGSEIDAIDAAIKDGPIVNATRQRCFWHLVHQQLMKKFGNGSYDSELFKTIRYWLNELAQNVETESEFRASYQALREWVQNNFDSRLRMAPKKGDVDNLSRVEALLLFLRDVVALREYWVKYERMGLCNLGQITTAISEAANSAIKRGKLAVHSQMPIDTTFQTIDRIERFQLQNNAVRADRRTKSTPLPNAKLCGEVVDVASYLTKRCVDVYAQPQYAACMKYRVDRVGEFRWCVGVEEHETKESTGAHPKFSRVREVHAQGGQLFCSCKFFESVLCPCRHILAVKHGMMCREDFHFRHLSAWQSGHIPVEMCPRTFADLSCGPSCLGVDWTQDIIPLEGIVSL
jgi:hypothetical protein